MTTTEIEPGHGPRGSGLLLHPTSLPGPYGIGELGAAAEAFVRALRTMRQRLWQVLPLGPTGYGDSPYQSFSSFAGNPLLISFDRLLDERLLARPELRRFPEFPDDQVDFGAVIPARLAVLRAVSRSFAHRASRRLRQDYEAFCDRQAGWLDDYALFMALKGRHGGRAWLEWAPAFAVREPVALRAARRTCRAAIRAVKIQQFLFDRQWRALRRYAHRRGVRIIGDLPIFVAQDSADVWAHPELFQLDAAGQPTVVAGVPPDYFSATGQRWGNPLYRWDAHRDSGYAWWLARLRRTLDLVDVIRLDHFRGFEKYWEIPAGEATAIHGRWVAGPGASFLAAVRAALGGLPLIAEDLGFITPEVHALREQFGLPGMRVLQFAFGSLGREPDQLPECFPENCVVYTGTHDNDTLRGWFCSPPGADATRPAAAVRAERQFIRTALGLRDDVDQHWAFIEQVFRTRARLAVVPLQDVLGLGSAARMNTPGRPDGNWRWRFRSGQLTPAVQQRLRRLTEQTGRA